MLDGATVITVISTGRNAPTKQKCIWSVATQTEPHEHIYIESPAERTVTQNVYEACSELPPNRIVAWLDGDDWLAHPRALETIARMHADGADCTYGSFQFSDGRIPKLRAYAGDYRKEPWLATHLKTFRAGLLASAPAEELQLDRQWIEMACDMTIMFAVLKRARNAVFCPEILCVYNYASSWEHRFTAANRAREAEIVRALRAPATSSSPPPSPGRTRDPSHK